MMRRWTPCVVAAAMLFAAEATAAESPRTTDLEILANGKLILRGELIDDMDDVVARLRVMREQEPPFELSLKLPKTFSFDTFAPVIKMLQGMGLGLLDDIRKPFAAPEPKAEAFEGRTI